MSVELTEFIRSIPDFPKPGILFRDITPLLASPVAFRHSVERLAERFRRSRIDLVAAAEARGFIFAAPIAYELRAGLIPVRKPGKLPSDCLTHTYDLEYGSDTLQVHRDGIAAGARVLVIDDLLATGGTVEACCRLVERSGGTVAGCGFVVELTALNGCERIARYDTASLVKYD